MPSGSGGKLSWQIDKGAAVPGFHPAVEISYDLQTWSTAPLEIVQDLEVREREANSEARKFVRLRADATTPE